MNPSNLKSYPVLLKMAAFSEFTIYSVTSLAAMVAMCQMRRLEYVRSEVSSTLIGQCYPNSRSDWLRVWS